MKAAVYRDVGDMRLEDLPDLEIKDPDEMLIRVRAAGLCGTDIDMYEGTNKEGTFPFVPCHEWAGEVIEVGDAVKNFKKGDKVTGEPFIPCGYCWICKEGLNAAFCPNHVYYGFTWENPGGFAEYTKAKEVRSHKLPPQVTFDEGALLEPLSVSYHGIWGVGGGVSTDDNVAIFGGGPIGLLALAIAKAAGSRVYLVEPIQIRMNIAEKMGADAVINPKKEDPVKSILDLTGGRGASVVVEASGTDQALAATVDVAQPAGRIVLIGHSIGRKVPIEIGKAIWKELKILGSCDSPSFFPKTIEFLARKRVDVTPVITHRFPLTKIKEALELGLKRTESAKIMIYP